MKYLVLLVLLVGCGNPEVISKKVEIVKENDRFIYVERFSCNSDHNREVECIKYKPEYTNFISIEFIRGTNCEGNYTIIDNIVTVDNNCRGLFVVKYED